ncbi:flagellar basal body-associated protein FliL [Siminovitchia sp. FSL H7-0308]|uniref:Flagellar protein FliL n=1 Tax=Siminovitchia thermophila TaxID=1245522 RepID=A0ABS2R9Y5_9BACI|nr:flagellar basal body-associated protein FliL [Siminovitchia thermophila]MBM7716471.1 flagellar FliL protein [Siminovitchia thermophila]ONK23231.1 flagellar basal body-associated protein FliL [Bacillus sp. VT-16-64]
MGKRIINILLIIFIVVLLGGTAYLLINDNSGKSKDKEPSIDEVLEASVHVNDITTNLQDGRYIKLSLTVETDGEEAKQELEKRDFQIRSIILSELADMKSGDLEGKEGKRKLEEMMEVKIGELLQNGEIKKVYITSYIVS